MPQQQRSNFHFLKNMIFALSDLVSGKPKTKLDCCSGGIQLFLDDANFRAKLSSSSGKKENEITDQT